MQETRKDELTAQKVETGLVFLHMLGAHDARTYMLNEDVPAEVVERLLAGGVARRTDSVLVDLPLQVAPAVAGPGFYCHGGRRQDVVRSAVVQAALVVREQLGVERARNLLRREGFPDEVAQRVLLWRATTAPRGAGRAGAIGTDAADGFAAGSGRGLLTPATPPGRRRNPACSIVQHE